MSMEAEPDADASAMKTIASGACLHAGWCRRVVSAEDTRSWVYRELGGLFDRVPEALSFDEPEAAVYARTQAALRALCQEFPLHSRAALESEQVRLCVNAPGGIPAPPYASYYLDGSLLGSSRQWVVERYRRQGLETGADAGQPADFVAIELEYLYFLCRHQRAARLTGDAPAFAAAARAEASFFRQHLSRWLPSFAASLAQATSPRSVFRLVADALTAFCAEEQARLDA